MTTTSDILIHEPWVNKERQQEAYAFGIWCFLATELLFFSALFLGYAVVRHLHIVGFDTGAKETSIVFGTVNTAVLMTSSLTMAMAERSAEQKRARLARWMLIATLLLGATFVVVKGFEYREDIEKHLVPGHGFSVPFQGAQLFFAFYWVMTGVHAVHLSIGLGVVGRLLRLSYRHSLSEHRASVEVTTLYWHLVDVIWVVLYPCFYLVNRS